MPPSVRDNKKAAPEDGLFVKFTGYTIAGYEPNYCQLSQLFAKLLKQGDQKRFEIGDGGVTQSPRPLVRVADP